MQRILFILALCLLSLATACSDDPIPYKAQEGVDKTFSDRAYVSSNGKNCDILVSIEDGRRSFYVQHRYGSQENRDCLDLKQNQEIQIIQRGDDYFWHVEDRLVPLN